MMLVGDKIGRRGLGPSQKKPYPGIFTAFLQKEWERTPRGLQSDISIKRYYCQMPLAEFFSNLTLAISKDRFAPYYSAGRQSESEACGLYAWNLSLCESLYPALNCLEISLRNSIHEATAKEFSTVNWFQICLKKEELDTVNQLVNDLNNRRKTVRPNDLVANLTLGFWLGLFRTRYEQVLWPKLLEPVFPNCPRSERTRQKVYVRLDKIRRLRNRVFHHEPIWHWSDLQQQHQQILETIGWISPAMLAMTRLLDRFPSVYTRGAQPYATELENIAQNWAR